MGSEENKINSFVEVKNSETFKQGKAVDDGVYDLSMGTFNFEMTCKVCKKNSQNCLGHMGNISLKYPVKNPLFIKEISLWLKVVCFYCSNLLLPIEKINHIQRSDISKVRILNEVAKKTFANKIVTCDKCEKISPNIIKTKGEQLILYAEYYEKKGKLYTIIDKQEISNIKIKSILDKITDETVLLLGKSLICHPRKLILTELGVSPNTIRPDKKKTSITSAFNNDITLLLQGIIDVNNRIPKNMSNTDPNYLNDLGKLLEIKVYDMIKGTTGNKTNITNHSGQSLISLAKRQTRKDGRIRKNMLGKRVDNAARSTITCNPKWKIDEVGMPISICKNISFPIHVQEYNYDECNYYFKNGTSIYPGCKFIKKIKTGEEYTVTPEIIKNYRLEIGDIVYRNLIDGDYFNFTRAPSLEPSSVTSMKIKVVEEGLTMQMNVITCSLFNADFDGDAMMASFSPNLPVSTEIELLSSVSERMLPYKNPSSMIGEAQDSLIGTAMLTHNKVKMDKHHANKLFNKLDIYHDFSQYTNNKLFSGRDIISILLKEMGIVLNYNRIATYYSPSKKMYRNYDPDNVNVKIENGKLISGILDKGSIGEKSSNTIFHIIAKEYNPNKALELCYNIQQIAIEFLNSSSISIGIREVIVKKEFLEEIYKIESSLIANSLEITQQLNDGKIISPLGKTLNEYYEELQLEALDIGDKYFEPFIKNLDYDTNYMSALVDHGSKGKLVNLKNYCVQIGQITLDGGRLPMNFGNRICAYFTNYDKDPKARGFIANSYMSGMDPSEFYAHSIDDRNNLIATATSTPVSGTKSRNLVKNMEPNIINNKRFVVNHKQITQILYGGDGMDPRYLEKVKILTCDPNITNIEFNNRYNIDSEEFKILQNDRSWFIDLKLNTERKIREIFDNTMYSVFNIKRIIENTVLENDNSKLTEKNVLSTVNNLCKDIKYSYFNEYYKKQNKKIFTYIEKACKLIIVYTRSWLNIYELRKKNITDNLLKSITHKIFIKFNNSFMPYGCCVGNIACLSYAEPITQAVISSKHKSGLTGQETTGMARINELIDARTTEDFNFNIELKDKYVYTKNGKENSIKIQKIINNLKSFKLELFTTKYQVFVEEYGNPVHPKYIHEKKIINDFEKFYKSDTSNLLKFCVRVEFKKIKMIEKNITISDISSKLLRVYNFIHIVSTPNNAENIFIRIYFKPLSDKSKNIDKDFVIDFTENLKNTIVKGLYGIKSVNKKYIINNKVLEDGTIKSNKVVILSIMGCNITEILFSKYFKNDTIIILSIKELADRFGILAARMILAKELHSQIGNSISYRHVSLFADEMTSTGIVTSLNIHGSNRRNASALLRMSDSHPINIMTLSSINNIKDSLSGVSSSLLIGKYPSVGSNYNSIGIDSDFIINEMQEESNILNDL